MLNTYRFAAGKFPVDFFTFKLTGSDVQTFLQSQSTYNISLLEDHHFHLLSFLDTSGKIEFYGWVLREKEEFQILVPPAHRELSKKRLEKFLISEDVTIEDIGLEKWMIALGPKLPGVTGENFYKGAIFEEPALLFKDQDLPSVLAIAPKEVEMWRALNGWPSFDGSDFKSELINNLRLYDLSVSNNKGCYPGQETVSKIATRRGAAYSPVLLETSESHRPGQLISFDKKIGEVFGSYEWDGKTYLTATLLRDFRVSGLKLNFALNGAEVESSVKYYPLLSGKKVEKAQELYYSALEEFKNNDYLTAEAKLKSAIELDPKFSDAYESLGVILGRLERFPEAVAYMDELTKADPSSVLAHTNKSLFLMRMGKIEEAEEQKSMATVKSFQKFGEEAKFKEQLTVQKKVQEEEWSKRESMFKQVLEIDDEDTLANYGLGSIAVERSDWSLAIHHLEKVIQADAQYSVAYLALGKAYKGFGDKAKAAKVWSEGILIAAKKGDLMPANQMHTEMGNIL